MRRIVPIAGAALAFGACELQEVVIAEAQPFVVVESFLAVDQQPLAALHASAGGAALLEEDAEIRLITADTAIAFERVDLERCLAMTYSFDPADFPGGLACYAATEAVVNPDSSITPPIGIQAGELYGLHARMPDGRGLEGSTRVPGRVDFEVAADTCFVEPWTQAELTWNAAPGAAAYILDLGLYGLREALAREGIEADIDEPFALRGVSIGEADTTIVLPAEIGVFDRFSLDPELALALQRGLPDGVRFTIVLAAVDENFVDWVRGGDFNPSGPLRTASLFGDAGSGVFGSMTTAYLAGGVGDATEAGAVRCGPVPTS